MKLLTILSPAKTINLDREITTELYTQPHFIKEAYYLIKELVKYAPPEMESLMKINSELAMKNFLRHHSWNKEHLPSNSRQAILCYDGAVYQGIGAMELGEEVLSFSNEHIRILSGLYGVLRPLDLIQPYRLEMAAKLRTRKASNLYDFWKDKLTKYFKEELALQNDGIIIDLASKEYSSAIDLKRTHARIVTPVFKDYKQGTYKNITIYAKRARGLMTRFILDNKIETAESLREFEAEGYSYSSRLSDKDEWVFTR
jgi:uncharacterized protein